MACDSTPSLLLMNNHDGTFREEGMLRGVALSGEGEELGGMGVGVGRLRLSTANSTSSRPISSKQATGLYRNDGKGEFSRT